jgi:TolA-binding protein
MIFSSCCLCVCIIGLWGCWTTAAEGEQLRTAAEARDRRIRDIEDQNRQIREEAVAKIKQIEEVLAKATDLLQRNSADVGAQTQQLQEQVGALDGKLAELRHDLERITQEMATQRAELEQKLAAGTKSALDPSQVPSDKTAHYNAAYQAYETADYDKARALFKLFLERYPADEKAGDAQYWTGASYLQQNRPATALGEYRKVIANYAQSNAVNVALYGMADAFFRLHACTDAKSALDALLKRKPKTSLVDRVKALQQQIKNAPAGQCTS